jgi:NAD(P)-dependent dehydrogenase (short-subunit alcohol dehydrogenase family)
MILFITGANMGLGLELVKAGLERGHTVIASGLVRKQGEDPIAKLAEMYPGKLRWVDMDVSKESSVQAAAASLQDAFPVIDCVINNAGVLFESKYDLQDPIVNLDIDMLRRTLDVNTVGHAIVLKYFMPFVYASKTPCVLNITSEAGHLVPESYTYLAYGVSKHAANMYTQKIRNFLVTSPEHGNVRIFMVHPGRMHTQMGVEYAQIQPSESANGIMDIAQGKIDPKLEIPFINYKGEQLPC